jgi:membrane protein required for colicin V production
MDMSLLDIVVIALVVLLGLKGLIRGLIKEVFGLLSIVGGVFFASRFADTFGTYIHTVFFPIENVGVRSLVGFVILFALIWAAVQLVGTLLAKMMKVSGLGFVDKLGGMAIGSAKVFLVFSIIAYGFGSVTFIKDMLKSKMENSVMYPLLYETGSYIVNIDSLEVQQAKAKLTAQGEKLTQELTQEAVEQAVSDMNESVAKAVGEMNNSLSTKQPGGEM